MAGNELFIALLISWVFGLFMDYCAAKRWKWRYILLANCFLVFIALALTRAKGGL